MKSILGMTALAALMMGTAVATVQANEAGGPWSSEGARLLLAEGGSERLVDMVLRRETLVSERQGRDSGERFVQMIEEQPTAAGPEREQQTQRIERSEPAILKNRVLYAPH